MILLRGDNFFIFLQKWREMEHLGTIIIYYVDIRNNHFDFWMVCSGTNNY